LEPFLAGGISSACASFEEGGTLRVSGRKICEIELVVESLQLGEFKYEQIVPEVARFTKEVVRRFVDNGSTSIRNLARVLCGGPLATLPGFYSYYNRHFPILEEGEEAAESLSKLFTKGGLILSHFLALAPVVASYSALTAPSGLLLEPQDQVMSLWRGLVAGLLWFCDLRVTETICWLGKHIGMQ
jgi:hypothetical protein